MTIERFDQIYGDRGGTQKLFSMKVNLATLKEISLQFGVSRERVRQWIKELYGEEYDPRMKRHNNLIMEIAGSIEMIGLDETKRKYKNAKHIREATKVLDVSNQHDTL